MLGNTLNALFFVSIILGDEAQLRGFGSSSSYTLRSFCPSVPTEPLFLIPSIALYLIYFLPPASIFCGYTRPCSCGPRTASLLSACVGVYFVLCLPHPYSYPYPYSLYDTANKSKREVTMSPCCVHIPLPMFRMQCSPVASATSLHTTSAQETWLRWPALSNRSPPFPPLACTTHTRGHDTGGVVGEEVDGLVVPFLTFAFRPFFFLFLVLKLALWRLCVSAGCTRDFNFSVFFICPTFKSCFS